MRSLNFISLTNGIELPSGEDFINKVFPNIWAFLVQLFAFIIMSLIVIKFAYKPVHNFLVKRREYIENNLKEAEEKNKEADKNIKKSVEDLNKSKKESLELIASAKKEAIKEKEQILDQTRKEIALKRLEAQEDIKKEQDKAIKQVHDDVVSLACATSKEILKREVNIDDDQKLIDDFVSDLIEKR